MRIVKVENYQELSRAAAEIVAQMIEKKKKLVLGLATGSTPEGMYARLVQMFKNGEIDFRGVISFNLDEYLGLSPEHPQSYHYYMHRHFFDHVNISSDNIHIPSCDHVSAKETCREYDQAIYDAGGIDLQILGIGANGHVGFNEPASTLSFHTHLVDLTEETIIDNSRFFKSPGEVPRQAVTVGMGTIMHAGKVLLLASGRSKASAVRQMSSGLIATEVPASLLQLHRNITVIADVEAASLI